MRLPGAVVRLPGLGLESQLYYSERDQSGRSILIRYVVPFSITRKTLFRFGYGEDGQAGDEGAARATDDPHRDEEVGADGK